MLFTHETQAVSPSETAPCINANVTSGIALSVSSARTLAETNSCVNDWPNTAHICQCGVSVPDAVLFPPMCRRADRNAAEGRAAEGGKRVEGYFSPP